MTDVKSKKSEKPAPPRGTNSTCDDRVFMDILQDMMAISDEDIAKLETTYLEAGGRKSLDEVALEAGRINHDQRDCLLRRYLDSRIDEMRKQLMGTQVGSYHILSEISHGGAGIVFKARQESPMFTRDVALKFLLAGPDATPEAKERFVSEAKALAGLSHPFLVPIFDSGMQGDHYYFSMEYVDGEELHELIQRQSLSLTRRIEVVRDVALALSYLHGNGVIHRDVKPGNIMVDRHGTAKLLDFGIAHLSADARRRAVQAGTPHYMAPEVIDPRGDHGPIGPGTDIYALGSVLYELLTGAPPFSETKSISELFSSTLSDPPSFPRRRDRRIHPELERIASRCLKKQVAERYATAEDLAEDLNAFLRRKRYRAPLLLSIGSLLLLVFWSLLPGEAPRVLDEPPVDTRHLDARLEEIRLVDAAAAARLRDALEGVSRSTLAALTGKVDGFWAEKVREAIEPALEEMKASTAVPVAQDAAFDKLYQDGNEQLIRGKNRKPDKEAHDCLRSAAGYFQQARRRAQELLLEKRREREAMALRDAAAVEERASRQKEMLEEEHLLELSAAAREAHQSSLRRLEEGKANLEKKEFQQAISAFLEAEEGFSRARREAWRSFMEESKELNGFIAQAEGRYGRQKEKLEKNLSSEDFKHLEDLLASVHGSLEGRRLAESRKSLSDFLRALVEAQRHVRGLETSAREAWRTALQVSRGAEIPEPLEGLLREARKDLREAEEKLEAGSFEAARLAFEASRMKRDELRRNARELTAGMAFVEGGLREGRRVPGFWIDVHEVSVGEYGKFLAYLQKHGHKGLKCCTAEIRDHKPLGWDSQRRSPRLPVVGVSLQDAKAYAFWRGKTLPARAQWELAACAKGSKRLKYPYGDTFDPGLVNGGGDRPEAASMVPVDDSRFIPGASACGCLHLSGNAAEWVVEPSGAAFLMGGSCKTGEPEYLRADYGFPAGEGGEDDSILEVAGFRCALRAAAAEVE